MNSNNSILLIDPEFDPATATNCSLVVKIGLNNFSYAIINQQTKQINAVYDEQECDDAARQFDERLKTDGYLSLPYQEIKLAVHTENAIAVPDELFDEKDAALHSKFFTDHDTNDLYVQPNTHFGFTTIFTLPAINPDFKVKKKYPQSVALLSLAENLAETALILDFSVGSFHVLYVKNRAVIFQKSYEVDNLEEFNYYALLLINQLNINTKETNVYLSGIIHQDDEKYNCLHQYFTTIDFTVANLDLDQQVLDDMPAHYYSSLLALNQCG